MYIYTHTHTHTHTHTYACTHARTHAHKHTRDVFKICHESYNAVPDQNDRELSIQFLALCDSAITYFAIFTN